MSRIGEWEGGDSEFEVQLQGEHGQTMWVYIEKSGGGTVGEEYYGLWNWSVGINEYHQPAPQTHKNALDSGTPINHLEAARLALEFWEANES